MVVDYQSGGEKNAWVCIMPACEGQGKRVGYRKAAAPSSRKPFGSRPLMKVHLALLKP
jgi:hypothetical protein